MARNTGLVLFLPIDEGVGTAVKDRSGLANDGVAYGGISWVLGKLLNALLFNGSSGYVSVPHSANLVPSTEITVEAWMKVISWIDWSRIVCKSPYPTFDWELTFDGSHKVYFIVKTAGSDIWSPYTPVLSLATWYHLVGTYKSGVGCQLYFNGVAQGSPGAGTGSITNNAGPINIGRNPNAAGYSNTVVDEVLVYNRCLSAQEIMDDYLHGPQAVIMVGTRLLPAIRVTEDNVEIYSKWQGWSGSTAKYQSNVLGSSRLWVVECEEQDVLWNDSSYSYLTGLAGTGASTTLYIQVGQRLISFGKVAIEDVALTADLTGMANVRKFSVRLCETL
jgi:hypothetical protein